MSKIILTSSFSTVAKELHANGILPTGFQTVAFIPTAGDAYRETPWISADEKALLDLGYVVQTVVLSEQNADTLWPELADVDIIFVAGGNTTYLAQMAHESGFTRILGELLTIGKTYIGSSAGSILAGPTVTPFVAADLPELPNAFKLSDPTCLGLVDYVVLPHDLGQEAAHEKTITDYPAYKFVRLTDAEYRVEEI